METQQKIAQLDRSNLLGSIGALGDQLTDAWRHASAVEIPPAYRDAKAFIVAGMGGSGLAGRMIESIYGSSMRIPFERIHGYTLPAWADEDTLVIVSSYSGNTEEMLALVDECIRRGCLWMAIGSGGALIERAREHGVPFYQIEPVHNPSNQPRMAIGYSLVGQLALACSAKVISVEEDVIVRAAKTIVGVRDTYLTDASDASELLEHRIPVFVSAGHLVGATHVVNNQLNENAKHLSFDFEVPEMNHHVLEALGFPEPLGERVAGVFVESRDHDPRLAARMRATRELFEERSIPTLTIAVGPDESLIESFEVIAKVGLIAFALAMRHGIDPSPIPNVEAFKEKIR